MLDPIIFMLLHRWYVFVFLGAFLIAASQHWGWKRTFKFLLIGYVLALASEASSIRNGFPYGIYHYNYHELQGEPLIFGVPFWDSLSYVFLTFSGFMMALFIRSRWDRHTPLSQLQNSWLTLLFGAALTTLLDVVIDPVAHLGGQWFLGNIYYYPERGFYFDVPLSNFGGWFLVTFSILLVFKLTDRLEGVPRHPESMILGVLLYWGVYLFNLGITLWLQQWTLAIASGAWGLLLIAISRKQKPKSLQELL